MKIVKFFSLLMLLSIAFVACKDSSKAEQTAANTPEAIEAAFQTSKTELMRSLKELHATVSAKITEAEKALESADEATKAEINIKLESLNQQRTSIENIAIKASSITAETWADFEKQTNQMVSDIKTALNK